MSIYVSVGYVDPNYVDNVPLSPISPEGFIVNISRSIIIGGADVSEYVTSLVINKTIDRLYHTISMTLMGHVVPVSNVRNVNSVNNISVGSDIYSCTIVDMQVDFKGATNITLKTDGCQLDVPFTPKQNYKMSGESTIILQSLLNGMSSSITTSSFSFNKGSFNFYGTRLDGISKILDVTKANYYENNGTLYFKKALRISSSGSPKFIFNNDIMTNKQLSDNYDGANTVHKIIINRSVGDLLSVPKITMITKDSNRCDRPFFIFNPIPTSVSEINSNLGDISFSNKIMEDEDVLNDNRVFTTDGGIYTITKVTVDGVETTDYVFEVNHNIILFDTAITGVVKVVYSTKSVSTYSQNGRYNSITKTNDYILQYLNQKLEQSLSVCHSDNPDDTERETDSFNDYTGCRVRVSSPIKKNEPITVEYSNGTLNMMCFISDPSASVSRSIDTPFEMKTYGSFDDTFLDNVTIDTDVAGIETLNKRVEDLSENSGMSGKYGFIAPIGLDLSNFMIGSRFIAFDSIAKDSNFKFWYVSDVTMLNKSVTMEYVVSKNVITIPPCGATNDISSIDIYVCDNITTVRYPDEEDNNDPYISSTCEIPRDVPLDFTSLFGLSASTVSGKTVYSSSFPDKVIPDNGILVYNVTELKKYVFDTGSIQKGSEVYIDCTNATLVGGS